MSCVTTFQEKGLKLTPQRRLIMDIIHDTKAHLTAEEIIAHVQNRMPGVNKSTIYRTLELLEKTECVFKSKLGDRFIYHHAEEGHHHHLVCRRCGATIECDEDLVSYLQRALVDTYGFQGEFKHMVIYGVCRECREKV